MKPPFRQSCNIDARGKAVRLAWGMLMLLAAIVLAVLGALHVLERSWSWPLAGGLVVMGVFGIYEARAGWCVVRAMGIKTKF